jgi:hypothetical protein
MAAIGRDPKPQSPAEADARAERVKKLLAEAAADYRTGFGKKPSKALAA